MCSPKISSDLQNGILGSPVIHLYLKLYKAAYTESYVNVDFLPNFQFLSENVVSICGYLSAEQEFLLIFLIELLVVQWWIFIFNLLSCIFRKLRNCSLAAKFRAFEWKCHHLWNAKCRTRIATDFLYRIIGSSVINCYLKFCKGAYFESYENVDFLLNSELFSENVSICGFLSATQAFLLIL